MYLKGLERVCRGGPPRRFEVPKVVVMVVVDMDREARSGLEDAEEQRTGGGGGGGGRMGGEDEEPQCAMRKSEVGGGANLQGLLCYSLQTEGE